MSEISVLTEYVPEELSAPGPFTIQFVDGISEEPRTGEISVLADSKYQIDLSPFIPQSEFFGLEGFYSTLQEIVNSVQERQGIIESERIKVVQEYPPDPFPVLGDAVITVEVLTREPAKMDQKGTGRPQRGWGFAYNHLSANEPNKTIIIESRPIDHMIQITVWAKTATIANDRALWLERNLIREAWAFKIRGADRFNWEGRGKDTLWTSAGARLHQRPLKFHVRLFEFMPRAHNQIKQISFVVRNKLI